MGKFEFFEFGFSKKDDEKVIEKLNNAKIKKWEVVACFGAPSRVVVEYDD